MLTVEDINKIFDKIENCLTDVNEGEDEGRQKAWIVLYNSMDQFHGFYLRMFAGYLNNKGKEKFGKSYRYNFDKGTIPDLKYEMEEYIIDCFIRFDQNLGRLKNYVKLKVMMDRMYKKYSKISGMASLDKPVSGKDGKENATVGDFVGDDHAVVDFDRLIDRNAVASIQIDISKAILEMFDGQEGENARKRKIYYESFFTENAAKTIKICPVLPNEDRIYKHLVSSFIDCIMEEMCYSANEIRLTSFKKAGHFGIEQSSEKELDYLPKQSKEDPIEIRIPDFEAKVYTYYFSHEGEETGIVATDQSVSSYRKDYKKQFDWCVSVND